MSTTAGPTPWSEVRRALDGPRVAALVGLPSARERAKHACPACDSSDGCHVYVDRAKCYSCGWSGSVIDLAALVWRIEPDAACRRLAELYGIRPDPMYRPRRMTAVHSGPAPDGPSPDVCRARAEVYGDMVALQELGPGGRDYLAGRGLSPDLAGVHGLRSIESPGAWAQLRATLHDRHDTDALVAAGLWCDGLPWLPWAGRVPALMIPYLSRSGRQVEAIRWRRMTSGPRRYMAPIEAGARIPWGAEAVDGPRPLRLVVTEGELDALACRARAYDALALGGATPSNAVLSWIVETVGDVDALALWLDDDAAGEGAVDRLGRMFARRYGAPWVREHVTRWTSAVDPAELLGGDA